MKKSDFVFQCKQRIQKHRKKEMQMEEGSTALVVYSGEDDIPLRSVLKEATELEIGKKIIYFNKFF